MLIDYSTNCCIVKILSQVVVLIADRREDAEQWVQHIRRAQDAGSQETAPVSALDQASPFSAMGRQMPLGWRSRDEAKGFDANGFPTFCSGLIRQGLPAQVSVQGSVVHANFVRAAMQGSPMLVRGVM